MAIPISYNVRNLIVRKTTTLMTAIGIALTVAVLAAVFALVSGLWTAFAATGDPLHVLVMRQGGNAELVERCYADKVSRSSNRFRASRKVRMGSRIASLEIVPSST